MAIVTVKVGALCSGGAHVEISTLVDGRVVSREFRPVVDVIKGRLLQEADAAKERLLSDTSAQNIAQYKIAVEAKSIVISDVPETPAGSEVKTASVGVK
jgi:hypothetical protein